MTKSRGINAPRRKWTADQVADLRNSYPTERTEDISARLGIPMHLVYAKANNMGLHKGAEFLASSKSGRILRGGKLSVATQFQPGQVSHNKGLRRPGWHRGRMRETMFKKGQRPHTWLPVGREKVNVDQYLVRKVSDTGNQRRDWVPVHRLVWIAANGPVPEGHVICFKKDQHTTKADEITLGVLELVSRAELARRNRMWTVYPKEIAQSIHLLGQLRRRIRKREEEDVSQDGRSKGSPIRNAGGTPRPGKADGGRASESDSRRRPRRRRHGEGRGAAP